MQIESVLINIEVKRIILYIGCLLEKKVTLRNFPFILSSFLFTTPAFDVGVKLEILEMPCSVNTMLESSC